MSSVFTLFIRNLATKIYTRHVKCFNFTQFYWFINDLFHFPYNYSLTHKVSSGSKLKIKIENCIWTSHCSCFCYDDGMRKRFDAILKMFGFAHGLRIPNEGINQRNLKIWANVADKICFDRT